VEYIQILSALLVVSSLRWLVAGLSPRKPWFAPGLVHVGFVGKVKVALRQVSSELLWFLLSVSLTVALYTHIPLGE